MTPIPAELDLSRKTGVNSPDQDETKSLRLAAENLAYACQERKPKVNHQTTIRLPLHWGNEEPTIKVKPYLHLGIPTNLLGAVGNHPLVSEEEQQFIADFFGLKVAIDRRAGALSLDHDGIMMKVYIGNTHYFSALSPLSLLLAGFLVLPDKKTYLTAAKNGLVIGNFDRTEETIMAVPGRIMTECGAEAIPWLRSFRDDYLYPVTLHKNRYVRPKNIDPKHQTEIFTSSTLLFHHDSGFFRNFKPVAVQTKIGKP